MPLPFTSAWLPQLAQDIGNEVSGETPDTRLQQSDTVGTASQGRGHGGATGGAGPQPSSSLVTNTTGRARGPSLLGPSSRAAAATAPPGGGAGRQDQSRQGTQATTTGGGRSSSMLSGSHSGVAGGGSAAATTATAAAGGGARSGAAAARQTVTSRGVVPGWDHLRMRYNNTKALAYQVPAKLPSKVVQQQRLLAAARRPPAGPAGAAGGPSRGARLVASSQQAAAAGRRGSSTAAGRQGSEQQTRKAAGKQHPATQQQVPESPNDEGPLPGAVSAEDEDTRAAVPPPPFNTTALVAEAAMDGDQPGHDPSSPEDMVADTDARPPLLASSRLPALLGEAAAGGIATQKRLFVGHVPSQHDGGSTTTSPTHGAPAAEPLQPGGGGWLVPAVTRAIRAAPARPSATAVAALGSMAAQHVAPAAAATAAVGEAGVEPMDAEVPVASEPAGVAAPAAVPERRHSACADVEAPVADEAVKHAAAGIPEQQGQRQDTKQGSQQATPPGRKQNRARRKSGHAVEAAATTAERRRTRSAAATIEAAGQPAQQEAAAGAKDAGREAAAPAVEPDRRRVRVSTVTKGAQALLVNDAAPRGAEPARRRTCASAAAEAEPAQAAAPEQSPTKAAPNKLRGAAARWHQQRMERNDLEAQPRGAQQAAAAECLPAEQSAQEQPGEPIDVEPAGKKQEQQAVAAPSLPEKGSCILYAQVPPPGLSSGGRPVVVQVGTSDGLIGIIRRSFCLCRFCSNTASALCCVSVSLARCIAGRGHARGGRRCLGQPARQRHARIWRSREAGAAAGGCRGQEGADAGSGPDVDAWCGVG